jgi:hypothetical protein
MSVFLVPSICFESRNISYNIAVKETWPPLSSCTTEQVFKVFDIIHKGIEVGSSAGFRWTGVHERVFLKNCYLTGDLTGSFPLFSHFLSLEEACAVENPTVSVFS